MQCYTAYLCYYHNLSFFNVLQSTNTNYTFCRKQDYLIIQSGYRSIELCSEVIVNRLQITVLDIPCAQGGCDCYRTMDTIHRSLLHLSANHLSSISSQCFARCTSTANHHGRSVPLSFTFDFWGCQILPGPEWGEIPQGVSTNSKRAINNVLCCENEELNMIYLKNASIFIFFVFIFCIYFRDIYVILELYTIYFVVIIIEKDMLKELPNNYLPSSFSLLISFKSIV